YPLWPAGRIIQTRVIESELRSGYGQLGSAAYLGGCWEKQAPIKIFHLPSFQNLVAGVPRKLNYRNPALAVRQGTVEGLHPDADGRDRKSTRLNSSHGSSSYAVFCLSKKNPNI